VQIVHDAIALLFVQVQDRLGIRSCSIAVTALLEPRPQFGVVVNLAVEHDPDGAVLIRHRLVAGGDVDDRQTSMRQTDGAIDEQPLAVRAAMPHDVAHPRQTTFVDATLRIKCDDSSDAAHKDFRLWTFVFRPLPKSKAQGLRSAGIKRCVRAA
jgi:hypothetical protein